MARSIIDSYALWWRGTGRSTKTLENYRYSLERLAERLGGQRQLVDATLDDLRSYQADRLEATSPGTASVDFRALRSFYAWCDAEGELDGRNPAERLKGPKVYETPVEVATETDYKRLIAACPKTTVAGRRDAAIIAVLWATGMRRGELVVLDLEHLDLDAGVLSIRKTKNGTPRRVPLDADTLALLDRWLRRRGYDAGPVVHCRARRAAVVQRRRADVRAPLRARRRRRLGPPVPSGAGDALAAPRRHRDGAALDRRLALAGDGRSVHADARRGRRPRGVPQATRVKLPPAVRW